MGGQAIMGINNVHKICNMHYYAIYDQHKNDMHYMQNMQILRNMLANMQDMHSMS